MAEPGGISRGSREVREFLARQVAQGTGLPAHQGTLGVLRNRIAVRFAYEWHMTPGTWFRSYGNENWAFNDNAS